LPGTIPSLAGMGLGHSIMATGMRHLEGKRALEFLLTVVDKTAVRGDFVSEQYGPAAQLLRQIVASMMPGQITFAIWAMRFIVWGNLKKQMKFWTDGPKGFVGGLHGTCATLLPSKKNVTPKQRADLMEALSWNQAIPNIGKL